MKKESEQRKQAEDQGWEYKENVNCVECSKCLFTFDAFHVDGSTGKYSCPACDDEE